VRKTHRKCSWSEVGFVAAKFQNFSVRASELNCLEESSKMVVELIVVLAAELEGLRLVGLAGNLL
jgi:hypothetical protein